MKVALYVAELDVRGGTHKQVLRLAEHLIGQGHEVVIYTPYFQPSKTYSGFSGLKVCSLGNSSSGRLIPYLKLAARMPRFDIVHIHDNRGVAFFLAAKALLRGRRFIWQINDLHPSFGQGNGSGVRLRRRSAIHRVLNRVMGRMVDSITVNVGKNVTRVEKFLTVKPHLFYCGVDIPANDAPAIAPVSQSSDAHIRAHRLLSAGTFVPYRNYELLLEGVAIAKSTLGRVIDVTIVGDTRYDSEYVRRVRQLADSRGIRLTVLENLSDEALRDQFNGCDIFAFVNIDQSWGLAVFEAAAARKPVVLSESVGAAEVLSGRAGFMIVDPLSVQSVADGIVAGLKDSLRTISLGQSARQAIEHMTWATSYSAPVESLYMSLLTPS